MSQTLTIREPHDMYVEYRELLANGGQIIKLSEDRTIPPPVEYGGPLRDPELPPYEPEPPTINGPLGDDKFDSLKVFESHTLGSNGQPFTFLP